MAVWGPHTEDLSSTTWKLTVTKRTDHHYAYTLSAKAKTASDSQYHDVLTGTHTHSWDMANEPIERRYLTTTSASPEVLYGNETADCPFVLASYSNM